MIAPSISPWIVFGCALAYLAFLFFVAYLAEGAVKRGNWIGRQIKTSSIVYTLSIAVYCTSWTFFGAVGTAASSGLEFIAIYLGPSLVFFGWLFLFRKLARIARTQRVTSIADFLSSRFGKSQRIGALVTLVALVATTPYIALQLKAVGQSIQVLTGRIGIDGKPVIDAQPGIWTGIDIALLVAIMTGLFTLFFGTRHLNANERHSGIISAIAFESVVKLVAFVGVGVFVVWGLYGSPGALIEQMTQRPELASVYSLEQSQYTRWFTLLIISTIAAICLPRQFQVTVVENEYGDHLRAAAWMFPLYLFVLCLFVVPVAWVGLATLPQGASPDMFVLTLPLMNENASLALLAFIGGFSSATSMMIIATIVLALMLCNHIILPQLIRAGFLDDQRPDSDFSRTVLNIRRFGIVVVLLLGYAYLRLTDDTTALASIGLISFAGAAQFLPAILFGVFWRDASKHGAFWGISVGTAVWIYTLLLPVFERSGIPLGLLDGNLGWLHPEGLFGINGWDPLAHSLFFSITLNTVVLFVVSNLTSIKAIEADQANRFVNAFSHSRLSSNPVTARTAPIKELWELSLRFLGAQRSANLFSQVSRDAINAGTNSPLNASQTNQLLASIEAQLSASLGAASARVIVNRLARAEAISPDEAMQILDEAQQLATYSAQLEEQRLALEITAKDLATANERLMEIDKNKDDFLRQVSHELRTPLTSVRSFVEVIESTPDLEPEKRTRFLTIIRKETERLTRLLEGILAQRQGHAMPVESDQELFGPNAVVHQCCALTEAVSLEHSVTVQSDFRAADIQIIGNADLLQQAVLNLLTNAIKFADPEQPNVIVKTQNDVANKRWRVSIHDNGPGFGSIDPFAITVPGRTGRWLGAGVGLRITKDLVSTLSGEIRTWDDNGAVVEISIPCE